MDHNIKDVQDELTNIVYEELEKCKSKNKVPSRKLLDTMNVLINLRRYWL